LAVRGGREASDLRAHPDGRLFLATDNDGVEDNYGETLFFSLGRR
jgi:hypothetical protein